MPLDEQLETLASIFPGIDSETLADILAIHGCDIEAAVTSLLDVSSDWTAARNSQALTEAQLDEDSRIAHAVHQEIQRELQEQHDLQSKKSELGPRAAAAALAMRQRLAALSTKATLRRKTYSTRLLDDDGAADTNIPASPLAPLYEPPQLNLPTALPAPAEAPAAIVSHPNPSALYDSRMQRAREARQRRSSLLEAGPPTASTQRAAQPQVHVPEGQLI